MKFVKKEGDGINGAVAGSQDGKASVAIYVSVANLAKALAKVEKAGGRMAMPPMELPNNMGSIAGFTDPASNWIGLWEAPKKAKKGKTKKKAAKKAAKKKSSGKRK